MRVLILGATGMLGHQACRSLSTNHQVFAGYRNLDAVSGAVLTCYQQVECYEGLDAEQTDSIAALILQLQPDVVLNCIGVVKQKADGQDAIRLISVNGLLPHLLVQWCDKVGAKLIQISTDCVFSGSQGNYCETDATDPQGLYGRSKLLGEVMSEPHLTLRTSIIGYELAGSVGLLEWFRTQKGGTVQGYTRAIYSGLTTAALCVLIDYIIDKMPDLTGLYHVGSTKISKYDLLGKINARLDLGVNIKKSDSIVCDRSLNATRFFAATGLAMPSHDRMIEQLHRERQQYGD